MRRDNFLPKCPFFPFSYAQFTKIEISTWIKRYFEANFTPWKTSSWWLFKGEKYYNLFKKSIFLHISNNTDLRNVSWKFHREISKIGSAKGNPQLKVQRVYFKTSFFNLVDIRFDRNLSVPFAYSKSRFFSELLPLWHHEGFFYRPVFIPKKESKNKVKVFQKFGVSPFCYFLTSKIPYMLPLTRFLWLTIHFVFWFYMYRLGPGCEPPLKISSTEPASKDRGRGEWSENFGK